MRYNFHCHDCKADFKKEAKLSLIETPYGVREGIKCPLCKGKAEAKGIDAPGVPNGSFGAVTSRDKYKSL